MRTGTRASARMWSRPTEPRAARFGVVRVEVAQIPTGERHAGTGPSLQEVRVEDFCQRVDRVDVRREVHGRLRRAARDRALVRHAVEYRARDLREDVERVRVTWMRQGVIAFRRRLPEPHARHHAATLDAHQLRAHADPRESFAHEVPLCRHPKRRYVEAASDVEPLDDHRAVGTRGIRWSVDDHPRREGRRLRRLDRPNAVGSVLADRDERRRGAVDDVLARGVADGCEVELHRHQRRRPVERRPERCGVVKHARMLPRSPGVGQA